jgi:hypothetical protein
MSGKPQERAVDVVTVTQDDQLLDALSRGEPAPPDDPAAALLAAWRSDVGTGLTRPVRPAGYAVAAPDAGLWSVTLTAADGTGTRPTGPDPSPGTRPTGAGASPGTRSRRARVRRVLLAVAAVAVLAGAAGVAASQAGPGSPLWPITRMLYGDRATSRQAQHDAEDKISQARRAVAQHRYADANHLLNDASTLITQVRDEPTARHLRDEVAAVRRELAEALGSVTHTGQPAATKTPRPDASASSSPGGLLPPLPSLPLPSVSLPSLPVPLPSLPIG